jgi:hypothetical protein
LHEIFGKSLAGFDLGGGLSRPEDGNTDFPEMVYYTGCQRGFRADNDQLDAIFFDNSCQCFQVGRLYIQVGRYCGCAGIARGSQNL